MNVPERIFLQAVQGQVTVIFVPFQNPAPLQEPGHPPADHMKQVMELFDARRRGAAKGVVAGVILYIDAIQKKHVEVYVEQ